MEISYTGFTFVEKETGIYIGVCPDLNFTSSYANTFEEVCKSLQEACNLFLEGIPEKEYPEVSDLSSLMGISELPELNIPVKIKV